MVVISFPAPQPPEGRSITPAERAVAAGIAMGLSNAEIARSLRRSPHTVANQVAAILRKLHVGSRGALLAASIREGVTGAAVPPLR